MRKASKNKNKPHLFCNDMSGSEVRGFLEGRASLRRKRRDRGVEPGPQSATLRIAAGSHRDATWEMKTVRWRERSCSVFKLTRKWGPIMQQVSAYRVRCGHTGLGRRFTAGWPCSSVFPDSGARVLL